jgi:hypothetical protein
MKYQFKFTTRNKTYYADTFADNEIEAVVAIKQIMPNAQNIMIRADGKWRKPKDRFYNVRWFYLGYALLFVAGYLLIK